jgi:Domain of unknown function (DUF4440)
MKKNSIVLCMGLAFSLCFSTVSVKAQSLGTEEDVKQLKSLNSQYIQSWIRSDTATYNSKLWADDFLQQNSDGSLSNKKETGARFGKPRYHLIQYFYADNVEVRFITADVAMVHALTPLLMKDANGNLISGTSQYCDVYVRRGGKWVCVSANITNIAQPSKVEPAK